MSHYISSFLIEPVVRQARRFSRPTNDPPHATDLRPSLEDDQAWAQHAALATAAAAAHEEPPQMRTSTDTGVLETVSPTSLTGLESGEVQAWQNGETSESSLRLVETDNLERAVNARRYTLTSTDDASRNPLHVIPDGFRSSASSLNHSARSIIDANMSPADPSMQSAGANDQDSRGREGNLNSRMGDGSLPADDGMGHMRKRILAIQRTDSSNEAKARLVHGVMTEQHNISQQSLHGPHFPRTHSPASIQSLDRPFTPSSPKSTDSLRQTVSPPTSSSSNNDGTNPFHLTLDDLKPTYYQKPLPIPEDADQEMRLTDSEEEPKALGCAHYKRNIKLQCSACSRWYTCRFCHDAVEDHMLNRRETKNMLCMLCGCAQPASEECVVCSERGAWYYCDVCKLWDDDPQKSIYHCNDCGICRIGQGLGKDFFHCKTCCVCMSISIRDTHRCIERSTDCDCPICGEYMFTSPQTVVFMKCGHSIHHRCYYEHMKSSYRCPICSRSIANMEWQFRHLERAIESQPMPPEFQDTKAWVYCNDCSAKTSVKYHWLGLKCAVCDSYNTAQLQILSGPDTEAGASRVEDAPPTPVTPGISRANSRGRSRRPTALSRRPTTSAPPSATTRDTVQDYLAGTLWPPARIAHSVAPNTLVPSTLNSSGSGSDPEDSMDTDGDEYDEVDFWGGERSPKSRHASPIQNSEMAIDNGSDEEDEEDSEDEDMSDDADEDEVDEGDRMEIFGHR